jgi:hypothetical protein
VKIRIARKARRQGTGLRRKESRKRAMGQIYKSNGKTSKRKVGNPLTKVTVVAAKEGVVVTCTFCGHSISCRGQSERIVRAACASMKSSCPAGMNHQYIPHHTYK